MRRCAERKKGVTVGVPDLLQDDSTDPCTDVITNVTPNTPENGKSSTSFIRLSPNLVCKMDGIPNTPTRCEIQERILEMRRCMVHVNDGGTIIMNNPQSCITSSPITEDSSCPCISSSTPIDPGRDCYSDSTYAELSNINVVELAKQCPKQNTPPKMETETTESVTRSFPQSGKTICENSVEAPPKATESYSCEIVCSGVCCISSQAGCPTPPVKEESPAPPVPLPSKECQQVPQTSQPQVCPQVPQPSLSQESTKPPKSPTNDCTHRMPAIKIQVCPGSPRPPPKRECPVKNSPPGINNTYASPCEK